MGSIVTAILGKSSASPYVVIGKPHNFSLEPERVALGWYPAEAIRMNMLHERGTGNGRQRTTTVHAVCDRPIKVGRYGRVVGDLVCGARIKSFRCGDRYSLPPGTEITCPKCAALVAKWELSESIRHRSGPWMN